MPRFRCLSLAFALPPNPILAVSSSSFVTSLSISALFSRKDSEVVLTLLGRTLAKDCGSEKEVVEEEVATALPFADEEENEATTIRSAGAG